MLIALGAIAGYLLGSVSFAVVVSRVMRLPDPRSYGSKNPGATNVLRTGNKIAAILTLAGDALKGFVAVLLALLYLPEAAPYVGVAAFLGHLFPVFHRFQGGKGVATAAGVEVITLSTRAAGGDGAGGGWLRGHEGTSAALVSGALGSR